MNCLRTSFPALRRGGSSLRYSSTSTSATETGPRHLLSIADLEPNELGNIIYHARRFKQLWKQRRSRIGASDDPKQDVALQRMLTFLRSDTVALTFSKRSTRTRVSTEAAVKLLGGHPMFLGRDDIQLGVNESLYDTSKVISSMVSCIVARVGPHSDVADLAKHSSVPVINALSDSYHPLQTVADFLTMSEESPRFVQQTAETADDKQKPKIAWVGDANNVLFDMAIGAGKLGLNMAVATPKGYEIPEEMRAIILANALPGGNATLIETNVPEEAIKDADIIVTDTWVSMGQEAEKAKRLKDFEGFQITTELVARGGAKENWKFMHCLPRHPEEVSDEVMYSNRSLVFQEAENRLWAAVAVLYAFVVQNGNCLTSFEKGIFGVTNTSNLNNGDRQDTRIG